MKKIVAVVMLVALTLSLGVAQAEVRLKGVGWDYRGGEERPYVVLISETGEESTVYCSEEEQNEYLREDFERAGKEARDRTWWGRILNNLGF